MTTLDEHALRQAIARRHQAMLADVRTLVNMPTGPGGDGLDVSRQWICSRLEALGAKTELIAPDPRPGWLYAEAGEGASVGASARAQPPIAICRRENGVNSNSINGSPRRPVLISGHLDTVHPASSPFCSFVYDEAAGAARATGPGCADMKGGLVIALHALEALEEASVKLPWSFILNSDEETGSFASAQAIRAEARRVAALGGFGIAVEPCLPDGSIVTERSGSGQFRIVATGKSAHVGRDFASGASAVACLADAITRICALARPSEGLIVNVGPLQGGSTTNSVPDRAVAWGNLRFVERAGADRLVSAINDICATPAVAGTRLRLDVALARPAKPCTPEVRSLADLVQLTGTELGLAIQFARTGGVCDGNLMQDEGLPTLDTLGVLGGGLHTNDEWIDVASLTSRCTLLALTLLRASLPTR